ncbi:AAA family ATPase [Arthrobacter sp. H14]|uniref:AAA family ATPase n=1 Tax=Arthrobacter sp. H14 TaxID=1312959 RepID=UPI00047B2874|nr:AAA family ATPase [Arthrobacter sp. H14]
MTAGYASARRATLDKRRDQLSAEAAKQYHDTHGQMVSQASQASGKDSLPEATLEQIADWILTALETGDAIPGISPDEYAAIVNKGDIANKAQDIRNRDAAKQIIAAEQAGQFTPPTPIPLDAFIANAANQEEAWRIEGLWPVNGRVLCSAAYKAGKTTLIGNLLRSLVDGDPFLGRYQPLLADAQYVHENGVLLIDTEMTERQLGAWLDDQGIKNQHLIEVLCLRGQLSAFNILDPATRTKWARKIEGSEVVILDNLRPVLDALGLDENREAGKFLTAWDEFMSEMFATESLIVHHTGHGQERARGDSALLASNDAMWTLIRDDESEEPISPRYFKAIGRDVDVPETLLNYDGTTRRLSIGGGNRKDTRTAGKVHAVLDFLKTSPGTSKTGIKTAIPGDDKDTAKAIDEALRQGLIRAEKNTGRGGGFFYHSVNIGGSVEIGTDVNSFQVVGCNPTPEIKHEELPGFNLGEKQDSPKKKSIPPAQHNPCQSHPVTPRPDLCEDCNKIQAKEAS